MKCELVRQVAPFSHFDGVDLTYKVSNRRVRGGQLLAEALVPAHPFDRAFVALCGHELTAVAGNGVVGVVEHFRTGHDGQPLVQQVGEATHDPCLGLASLAEKDYVVPSQQGVLQGGQHGAFITHQAVDDGLPARDARRGIGPDLLLDRA